MTELEKAKAFNLEMKRVLQTVYDALNQGQQQKLMKDPLVKTIFIRYGVGDGQ